MYYNQSYDNKYELVGSDNKINRFHNRFLFCFKRRFFQRIENNRVNNRRFIISNICCRILPAI